MKCLVCKHENLRDHEITPGLDTKHCDQCGGNWLRFDKYIEWNRNSYIKFFDIKDEPKEEKKYMEVSDSNNPKLCPDCGTILRVYKVASNLSFRIENCAYCNGIWFDKNEWETLKENNLHHQIHKFFTDSWQKKLREEERKNYFEEFYTKKFGKEDYDKVKEVRAWITDNKNKSLLFAYLMNKDPYKL